VPVARRGTSRAAAHLVRAITADHDEQARTAHDIATDTADRVLPDRVRSLLDGRTRAVQGRRTAYWQLDEEVKEQIAERQR